jgi:polyisoprenoid-binding protein YceI
VGGSGTPSEPISAPTLDINAEPTQAPEDMLTQLAEANAEIESLRAQVSELSTQAAGGESAPEQSATEVPTATESQANAAAADDSVSGRTLYRIDQRDSRATFTLTETLQGQPNTVIGGTNEVAGDVIIDYDNPAQSQVGTIRINARTLETDSELRNRALRAEILRSRDDDFEYIEFVPTQINGLPESAMVGETYTFDIVGDLTVIGTTNNVTFNAEVTLESASAISGTASTTIAYADWGIIVPDAVGVADVSDEAVLAIEFVMREVEE